VLPPTSETLFAKGDSYQLRRPHPSERIQKTTFPEARPVTAEPRIQSRARESLFARSY